MNKISIITVCLNSSKTIEQTICSVLNQSYKNIEYIIIDGLSTDGTQEIIEKYVDNLAYYISEKDEGLYDAMNKGINKATGDIIGIINSDDWYEDGIFERVNQCFEENPIDVLYGKVYYHEEGKEKSLCGQNDISGLIYGNCVYHPSVFVKKEIYDTYGGFVTSYRVLADYELMLRLYENGLYFFFLDKVIANFRVGGFSYQNIIDAHLENWKIALINAKRYSYKIDDVIEKNIEKLAPLICKENPFCFENSFKSWIGKQKLVLIGAGRATRSFLERLSDTAKIVNFIVDNNEEKWGDRLNDIEISSPEFLRNYEGIAIIPSHKFESEMLDQVKSYGNSMIKLYTTGQLWCTMRKNIVNDYFTQNSIDVVDYFDVRGYQDNVIKF